MTKENTKKLEALIEGIVRKSLKEMGSFENGDAMGDKDQSRVLDILDKSNGSVAKKVKLTLNMANAITNIGKAIARYKAALKLKEKEMATIFYLKALKLGYSSSYGS